MGSCLGQVPLGDTLLDPPTPRHARVIQVDEGPGSASPTAAGSSDSGPAAAAAGETEVLVFLLCLETLPL